MIIGLTRARVGDTLTSDSISTMEKRILNTELFSEGKVEYNDPVAELAISVKDRWTTIPIAKFGGSGELVFFMAGLYDINTFGSYLELGGRYEYYAGTNNGVIWFRKPEFTRLRMEIGADLWALKRVKKLYSPKGTLTGGFLLEKIKFSAFGQYPLKERFFIGASFETFSNAISDNLIENTLKNLNSRNNYSFDDNTLTFLPGLYLLYSGFDFKSYNIEGIGTRIQYSRAIVQDGSDYNVLTVSAQGYGLLPFLSTNLCGNLTVNIIDGGGIGEQYFCGGIDGVRGFRDNEFRGRALMAANFEARIPSLQFKYFVLQHVGFFDLLCKANRASKFKNATVAFGGGTGLRFIFPTIYGFIVRLDYAWGGGPYKRNGFYFGTRHYFEPY